MSDYGLSKDTSYSVRYQKDPSDTIDYAMSWPQLGSDTISTSSWTSNGLTIGTGSISGLTTSVFVSGGEAERTYRLTNTITTTGGRTLERSMWIEVVDL